MTDDMHLEEKQKNMKMPSKCRLYPPEWYWNASPELYNEQMIVTQLNETTTLYSVSASEGLQRDPQVMRRGKNVYTM